MFITPMLLATTESAFSHADYIYEPKIDGHRLILSKQNGRTRLYTRHKVECTRQYPELINIAIDDIVLDGEVACVDPQTGVIEFESVMERFSASRDEKINSLAAALPANYIVFDILRLNGQDLRGLPLMKRKEILAHLNLGNEYVSKIPYIEREGERLFEEIKSRQLEGIVAKRKESTYVSRRSVAWRKVINWQYADVVITGWRKSEFGWIAAIEESSGQLKPVGIIELGVSPATKKAFYSENQAQIVGENADYVFIIPRRRVRVKMRNWTRAGLLRSPVFVEFIV